MKRTLRLMVVLLLAVSSLTAGEVSEQQAMAQLIHLVVVIDCPEIGYPKLLDITIKPGTTVTSKGTTGIEELKDGKIEEWKSSDAWYDLQGRRLQGHPTQKGIYIHQEKKIKK